MHMGELSASTLFYLFCADLIDARRVARGTVGVECPGTSLSVPLGKLELLLLEVAIWELIDSEAVSVRVLLDSRPEPSQRRGLTRFIDPLGPTMYLTRRHSTPSPPPLSVAAGILGALGSDEATATLAILSWAGDRWPLAADAVVGAAIGEAVSNGDLEADRPDERIVRRRGRTIIRAPVPAFGRLTELENTVSDVYDRWRSYNNEHDDEAFVMAKQCKSALRAMRPVARSETPGGGS